MATERLKFPIGFSARDYQLPFINAMERGCKRAALVWHRRAGKEMTCWQWCIHSALSRVGTYWYTFPTYRLGRDIIWEGANKEGRRFLDYIPPELIDGKPNSQRMSIRLRNGSQIQVIGTENSIQVGTNPLGVVFSEFSLQNPEAWTLTRPILKENGGWAVFNFTPRGHNAAWELWQMAENNDAWFTSLLTVDDTKVLSPADIQQERDEGMSEEMIQQEYYCSWERGADGCYYLRYVTDAQAQGRIGYVPHELYATTNTYWDLGIADPTAIIFAQRVGQEIRIIDYYECNDADIGHYIKVLEDKRQKYGYRYGTHYAPHDIKQRQQFSGMLTRLDLARDAGIEFQVTPDYPLLDGIELVRGLFPRLWFDSGKCRPLLRHIENYHKKFNKTYNVYINRPDHTEHSHAADALRYLAVNEYMFGGGGGNVTESQIAEWENRYRRVV